MGLTDFYALAREVDPGWLALTVEGGYLWSLVAWTLVAFAAGAVAGWFARKSADEGRAGQRQPSARARKKAARDAKRQAVAGFSRDMARAVLAAYDADGLFNAGPNWRTVRDSSCSGEGVFARAQSALVSDANLYSLTGEWRAFLDDPRELERVRRRAEG